MHSAPGNGEPAANLPCCKELRVVATHAAKSVAPAVRQLVGEQDYVAAVFVDPPRVVIPATVPGTGPPRSLSFAESVLQRSLLTHAPPSVFPRV
jgi:hypothetical protein